MKDREKRGKMTVLQHAEEEQDRVVLVWRGDEVGEIVPNDAGVTHQHVTRVVRGGIEVRYRDAETIRLFAGSEISLDLRRPYDVEVIQAPAEVRCFYPRSEPEALENISHLRHEEPRIFPTRSSLAPTQRPLQ